MAAIEGVVSDGAYTRWYGKGRRNVLDVSMENTVIVTDSTLANHYNSQLRRYETIVINPGEGLKKLHTVAVIIKRLLRIGANKHWRLIGFGGGVITDMTGFAASIYMRGMRFGFVPTTLLAMVDAAIGGKNGVNISGYKNMVGVIRQPDFVQFDTSLLKTLPREEWSSGFAEIIKYAAIADPKLMQTLESATSEHYQQSITELEAVIEKCVMIKEGIVAEDEFESSRRKILNFGHTAGHGIEVVNKIPHGQAVGLGMLVACMVSEKLTGLDVSVRRRIEEVLTRYGLPVHMKLDPGQIMDRLMRDKKVNGAGVDFILLEQLGVPIIRNISFEEINKALYQYRDEYNHTTRTA